MPYYYEKGSDTYHKSKKCSLVPDNVEENPEWIVEKEKLSGLEICNGCNTKEGRNIISTILNSRVFKLIIAPIIVGVILLIIGILIKSSNRNDRGITDINVSASVNNQKPPQYSTVILTVTVKDQNNKAIPGASLEATAHYSSTETTKPSYTDNYGEAKIAFRIGPAKVDFEVIICVKARKGRLIKKTKTSFTPRKIGLPLLSRKLLNPFH